MSLIEKLKKEHPKEQIVFAAVENLTELKDIKQFYREYVGYLKKVKDKKISKNAESVARDNITTALFHYGIDLDDKRYSFLN